MVSLKSHALKLFPIKVKNPSKKYQGESELKQFQVSYTFKLLNRQQNKNNKRTRERKKKNTRIYLYKIKYNYSSYIKFN